MKKRRGAEQIVAMLRQADVALGMLNDLPEYLFAIFIRGVHRPPKGRQICRQLTNLLTFSYGESRRFISLKAAVFLFELP